MNKKRITWIELLRIAACIGVIGIHAGSQHFRDTPLDSSIWRISNFYHGINRFAVASFIMISGTLYQEYFSDSSGVCVLADFLCGIHDRNGGETSDRICIVF